MDCPKALWELKDVFGRIVKLWINTPKGFITWMAVIPLAFFVSLAGATKITVYNVSGSYVTLLVDGNGSSYLKVVAINGNPVNGINEWVYSPDGRHYLGYVPAGKQEYFSMPYQVQFSLYNAIRRSLPSSISRAVYDKRNHIRVAVVYPNGTKEVFEVTVYLSMSPNDRRDKIHGSFVMLLLEVGYLALLVVGFISSKAYSSDSDPSKRRRDFSPTSQWGYFSALWTQFYLGVNSLGLLLYYTSTPVNLLGDFVSALAILMLVTLFLIFASDSEMAKKTGNYHYLRDPPATGLEWTPFVMRFVFPSIPDWLWITLILGVFILSISKILRRMLRRVALGVSPLMAIFIVYRLNPSDYYAVLLMFLAFVVPYFLNFRWASVERIEEAFPPGTYKYRSPEVEELLKKFDQVIKSREMED